MRVLILHSDVAADAPADDQDTLEQAGVVARALESKGHSVSRASFRDDLKKLIARTQPDIVFNLVEAIDGKGSRAALAPRLLAELDVPYTGAHAEAMTLAGDKLLSKKLLAGAGLPTPQWAVGPAWQGVNGGRWIVKSVDEDSSLGLDDGAVVEAPRVATRATDCAKRLGGRWFAEEFIEGREFHVAVIEKDGGPIALPAAEMCFENWEASRPRILGANAKWDAASPEFNRTNWKFGAGDVTLHAELAQFSLQAFGLFRLSGYARVDFRVDAGGQLFILEINPNPSLAQNCALAASAAQAKMSYADLIECVVRAARTPALISGFPG